MESGRDPAFVPAASSRCASRPSGLQSGVVARVARALFETEWDGHGPDEEFEATEWYWVKSARAAIASLREPTEAMIEASNREWDGRVSHRSSGAWQAMIDAALSERTGA